jgi:NTP pyrophosphatase (non-canonical NTP hydrolase)
MSARRRKTATRTPDNLSVILRRLVKEIKGQAINDLTDDLVSLSARETRKEERGDLADVLLGIAKRADEETRAALEKLIKALQCAPTDCAIGYHLGLRHRVSQFS